SSRLGRTFIRSESTSDRFQDVRVRDESLELAVFVMNERHMDRRPLDDIKYVERIDSIRNIGSRSHVCSYVRAFAAQKRLEQILRLNDAKHLSRRAAMGGQSRMNALHDRPTDILRIGGKIDHIHLVARCHDCSNGRSPNRITPTIIARSLGSRIPAVSASATKLWISSSVI